MNKIVEKFKKLTYGQNLFAFYAPLSPLLIGIPMTDHKENLGAPFFPILFINKGRNTQGIVSDDAYKELAREVFRKYLNGKYSISFLKKLHDKSYNETKNLHDIIINSDIKKYSDKDLEKLMDKAGTYLRLLTVRTIYIETFDRQIVEDVIPNEYKKYLDNVWEKAIHPIFESLEIRRKKEILKIIDKYGITDTAARKATYIFTDYYLPKSIGEIKENLVNFDKNDVDNIKEDSKKNREIWIKGLNKIEKKLVEYIQLVIEMRDVRKDPIAWIQVVIAEAGFEMARRAGLEKSIVQTISPFEYKNGIRWLKENKKQLSKGKDGIVLLINDDGNIDRDYATPDSLKSDIKTLLGELKDISEIKGQIASKGIVRGPVKIIIDMEGPEVKNFKEGDILVTSMTRPEFIPLIKKAGAIITNEGGITCHAAIISRELGIPCIISTKNATQVLKDGDLVEVDADNGIVKIIK